MLLKFTNPNNKKLIITTILVGYLINKYQPPKPPPQLNFTNLLNYNCFNSKLNAG
jgi:hypothetical protein